MPAKMEIPPLTEEQQQLARDNVRLAYFLFARYAAEAQERYGSQIRQEVRSAALYGLCLAASKYDPRRGTRFASFARTVIFNAMRRAVIQHSQRRCDSFDANPGSEDERPWELPDDSPPADEVLLREERRSLLQRLLSSLPSDWRRAFLCRAEGKTKYEIGSLLGVAPSTAHWFAKMATDTLREAVLSAE